MQTRLFVAFLVAMLASLSFTGAIPGFVAADPEAETSPGVAAGQPVAEAQSQTEEQLADLVELGPGVHKVKLDDEGRVRSMIVVGQARISTVLGKAKGLQTARTRADLAVRAEFVKWLKEEVIVSRKAQDETVLFLEGSEAVDEETLRESGKSVERTDETIQSIASGLVRGLTLLHKEIDGKERVYTLVYGWSAERSGAAEELADPKRSPKSTGAKSEAAKWRKTIESERATSDEAAEFLE